jgi:Flp pilus assembly protein TadG
MRDRQRGKDDGASAVEFALVLPVLIILIFGGIAFGTLFAQKLALSNASREAARLAVVPNRTCGDVLASAQSGANSIGMNGSATKVFITRTGGSSPCGNDASYTATEKAQLPCQGSAANDEITVNVQYSSRLLIPLLFSDRRFDIDGTGVFRCEFS